jgi:hypothetical protein
MSTLESHSTDRYDMRKLVDDATNGAHTRHLFASLVLENEARNHSEGHTKFRSVACSDGHVHHNTCVIVDKNFTK